jgi:hypothetical protein
VTFLEKFVKTVKSKCEIIFNRFGSFGDVVSNNKILYAIPFFANWAFLIALEALKILAYARISIWPLGQRSPIYTEPRCTNNDYY